MCTVELCTARSVRYTVSVPTRRPISLPALGTRPAVAQVYVQWNIKNCNTSSDTCAKSCAFAASISMGIWRCGERTNTRTLKKLEHRGCSVRCWVPKNRVQNNIHTDNASRARFLKKRKNKRKTSQTQSLGLRSSTGATNCCSSPICTWFVMPCCLLQRSIRSRKLLRMQPVYPSDCQYALLHSAPLHSNRVSSFSPSCS